MAIANGTPPPSRDRDSSQPVAGEPDDTDSHTTTRAEITPLSPSKRPTDTPKSLVGPAKRSRHGSAPMEIADAGDINTIDQRVKSVRSIHDSLIERLSAQVLEQFCSTTVDEICEVSPQPPAYTQQRASIHLSLEDCHQESTSWSDLVSNIDDVTTLQLRDGILKRQIEMTSAALTLLQPDFQKLAHLHEHFLRIFGSYTSPRPAWQLDILHDLKAQLSLIKLQAQAECDRDQIIDVFYPHNAEQELRATDGKIRPMNTAETEFLSRCLRTRDTLMSDQSLKALRHKHQWQQFLQNAVSHVKVEIICLRGQNETHFDKEALLKAEKDHEQLFSQNTPRIGAIAGEETTEDDLLTQAALAAHAQERAHQASGVRASTSEQLAKGRIAASSKPSHRPRDPKANQSHRRPWSSEEEDALLKGLDIVKGPYWSQILALFGERGSVSNILRDRNQVQLKDKARNLKLFFLKNDQPVPKSLEKVTGDLKTRAPMYLLSPDEVQEEVQTEVSSAHLQSRTIGNGKADANGAASDREQAMEEAQQLLEHSAPVSPPPADEYSANEDMPDAPDEVFDEAMEAAIRQAVASVQAEQDRAQV